MICVITSGGETLLWHIFCTHSTPLHDVHSTNKDTFGVDHRCSFRGFPVSAPYGETQTQKQRLLYVIPLVLLMLLRVRQGTSQR
jgi:hypothetical protein